MNDLMSERTNTIALFDRVAMLDAIGRYSALPGLPKSEITFIAEQPGDTQ